MKNFLGPIAQQKTQIIVTQREKTEHGTQPEDPHPHYHQEILHSHPQTDKNDSF